jgi:hypothetical protein
MTEEGKIIECLHKADAPFLDHLPLTDRQEAVEEFRHIWRGTSDNIQKKCPE